MTDSTLTHQYQTWTKGDFFISTDPSLVPISALNAAFASDHFYWANPLPDAAMREALRNCLCFGVYEAESREEGLDKEKQQTDANDTVEASFEPKTFVGIARCITDRTTFLYLTDVYVDPSYQGKGLGKWLVSCVQEVIESMPYLRRSMLITGNWNLSVPFYEEIMGMEVLELKRGKGVAVMMSKGPGAPDWGARPEKY